MWKLKDYQGNEQVWYEAELIEKITNECTEALSECCAKGLDAECYDCPNSSMASLAQDILEHIKSYEGER